MSIIIGADLVPTNSNVDMFNFGDAKSLIGEELQEVLNAADYRIFNLEVPLTDILNPIKKCGPCLVAPTSTVEGLKALRVDLLTLANNHIMDQSIQGLESTLKTLKDVGISYVGVGSTLDEASKPFLFDYNNKKIGVYACAEHEFSIVSDEKPGANPIDLLETPDHIANLKKQCDYLIVLYHGGKEYYRYPSPNIQKLFRKLADKGADLVIAQHTHCVGCYEEYHGSTLVYGQGNFIFDADSNEYWDSGLLVQVNEDLSVSFIPFEKKENHIEFSPDNSILEDFYRRSKELSNPQIIENYYNSFAEKAMPTYLAMISPKESLAFKIINKLSNNKLRIDRFNCAIERKTIENVIHCEAHNELFLKAIQKDK